MNYRLKLTKLYKCTNVYYVNDLNKETGGAH